MVSKRRSNTIAAVGTVIFMLLLFLLLWFVCIYTNREPEEDGIEVAFGAAEDGGGYQPQESESAPSSSVAPPPAPSQPSQNDLVVQDDEESLALQKQREQEEKARREAEAERLQRQREEQARLEAERLAKEKALAEQRAKEQAAIDKANQFGSLFGNSGANAKGSGDTEGDTRRGNSEVGHGSSGGSNNIILPGRSCMNEVKPSNDFEQTGIVVVAIIVDAEGNVVSAKYTEGTTISNDATIQLAIRAAYQTKFSSTDRPDKQPGKIKYIFKEKETK